jgi:hypothetical protein
MDSLSIRLLLLTRAIFISRGIGSLVFRAHTAHRDARTFIG